ncbi:hypothetical protein [Aeromicrobium sp.]|uniref:hypothetical protein n=1 Tax=Aeromicrobium sp. TaxID=1871063 RepID=UPI0030BBFE3E
MEVDNLHATGRTIAGRSGGGKAAARGISTGLDSASGLVGHSMVKSAMSQFVTGVVDDSNKLGNQLENAGDNVSNVASTARSSDEEAAADVQTAIAPNTEISGRINRQI